MKLDLFEKGKKKNKNNIIKIKLIKLIIVVVVIGLIVIGLKEVRTNLYTEPYFNVTSVRIEGESLSSTAAANYCDLTLPINIFKVNLNELASRIKELHPEVKEAVVTRQLPDRLLIKLKRREPVAEIEVYGKFYKVDKEGFILPDYSKTMHPELPDIIGVRSSRILKSLLGVCDSKRLKEALNLLSLLKDENSLESYRITKIDVSNYRNVTFSIEDKIEIKLGRDNFKQKLNALNESLPSIRLDEVTYIDLRFDDITIGTE